MENLEQTFKGLADTNRLRILNLLLHGGLCVCEIQRVLASPQPNVSRHLTYLRASGLVGDRREGTRVYYHLVRPSEGARRLLFNFLRAAFEQDPVFAADIRRLREDIESGVCKADYWRPYAALSRPSKTGSSPATRKSA
ncbi:MAG: ArsR/SmtB family transcription factor [Acidobacteriaceae bacterium]